MDAIRVAKVENVQLDRYIPPTTSSSSVTKQRITITLHLTPHHLIFSPLPSYSDLTRSKSIQDPTQETDEIWVPYPSITLLTRLPQTIAGLYPLQIRTRNFESYVLSFERDRDGGAEDVWQSVKDCAVSGEVSLHVGGIELTCSVGRTAICVQLYSSFTNGFIKQTYLSSHQIRTYSQLPPFHAVR
jgi:myotubularin-related protein 6/7/8